MSFKMSIDGIQKLQDKNLRRMAELKPSGAAGKAIRYGLTRLHRYVVSITHVWKYKGGGLRASHRMGMDGLRGRIYIDPGAVNPRGQKPVDYGPYEHARGGTHAFYDRTVDEEGPETLRRMKEIVFRGLK